MNKKHLFALFAVVALLCALVVGNTVVASAAGEITTTATGYTKATDVNYKITSGKVANWGARGEVCTFETTYAQNYYTGNYTFENISQNSGSSTLSAVPQSNLYKALNSLMNSKSTKITSYNETKTLFRYTDCVSNDTEHISSFYSGKVISGSWDGTWNREHTWPNSKGEGSSENDIMMLRPTWTQENSDRGNTAYGQSSGYYDPGVSLRGDCARIMLYVYTRWDSSTNLSNLWGRSGVLENLDVMLAWMQADPVDTWEMGRNDAVQSITGVRNTFVDYPELAWLMFGRQVPADLVTPAGNPAGGTGGNGGGTGGNGGGSTIVPPVEVPDSNVQNFKTAVAAINNAGTMTDRYKQIYAAKKVYDGLSATDKANSEVVAAYGTLQTAITQYNSAADYRNQTLTKALAISAGTTAVATGAIAAIVYVLGKRKGA